MSNPHNVVPTPDPIRHTAIGFVRSEISGTHACRHADEIHRYALRSGISYAYTVRPPTDSADPIGYALAIAAALAADTIVVFDLEHTNYSPARICDAGYHLETVCPPTLWT
ncbi:hypothetical protein GV792_24630, partial [Nocardia cyriacigeorgica]